MTQAWDRLREHPTGRWLALVLEVAWYVALVLAVAHLWDVPQAYFSYLEI